MALRVYNTLSRQKEDFVPIEENKVRMYVCGPTVYDSAHMGHARSSVVFDVVYRYLMARGFDVTYVRNFTDVDDKIINRANELGEESSTIAKKYIDEFHTDMDDLFVLRPDHEPLATEHIENIVKIVEKLVEKGAAYELDGDVYFKVDSFEGYGKLSGRKLEDMEAGARVGVDQRKENPFDFALWKGAKPGEPSWDSPWGPGRPGWHIECSAMNWSHFGPTFDIHGGGQDLIFPHHENEIAQSEAAFEKPFVRYWMHNGFVNIDSEKMSKSLNNFTTVRDILGQYHPEAVRLFLLSKHYRSPVDFTPDAMADAAAGLERVYQTLGRIEDARDAEALSQKIESGEYLDRFFASMDDDMNTAGGLGALFEAVRAANRLADEGGAGSDEAADLYRQVKAMGHVLGLFGVLASEYFGAKKDQAVADTGVDPAQVEDLIQQRADARKAKDFARADAIRDELAQMGVTIKDSAQGTTWELE